MKLPIQKAVVLGAGTMGARIAAHFANAGLPCVLLDIVPPDLQAGCAGRRSATVSRATVWKLRRNRDPRHFSAQRWRKKFPLAILKMIWRAAPKPTGSSKWSRKIWRSSATCCRAWRNSASPGAIVTTNTSGLPVHLIAEGLPRGISAALGRHTLL